MLSRLSLAAALALALALAGAARADDLAAQIDRGAAVFAESCAICHGAAGEGAAGYPNPIVDTRSLGKFRHARGLYDYNRMMMPFDNPGSLSSEDGWAVTAWLMAENGWLEDMDAALNAENAAEVEIPRD